MLRYLTAGESHGQALVVIVEGLPSNLPVVVADIADEHQLVRHDPEKLRKALLRILRRL